MVLQEAYLKFFQQLQEKNIEDSVIITPNRRLSATLHKLYQQFQLDRGILSWQTPQILPFTTWIQKHWYDYSATCFTRLPQLLNNAQTLLLWKNCINHSQENAYLLNTQETAHAAQSAWSLLKQWRVKINADIFTQTEDYAALLHWLTAFQTNCAHKNIIDNVTLVDEIEQHIKNKTIKVEKNIFLFGFTELTPQTENLLKTCQTHGCEICYVELAKNIAPSQQISFADDDEEITTIARWAKTILSHEPEARIGCVFPNLDKVRDRIQQRFIEILPEEGCFNISAGKFLSQYPVIQAMINSLSLYKRTMTRESFCYLLSSPFIADAERERMKRAQFDRLLRKNNINKINLKTLLQLDNNKLSLKQHIPLLEKKLIAFYQILEAQPAKQPYSAWAQVFNELLTAIGWPGERSLSSEEYQTVENSLKLLSEYMSLDYISDPIDIHGAVEAWQHFTMKRTFQPETPDAAIQILGVLEAAGLPFDYLWIAGMNDLAWPPQPQPHPFIPKSLQRELQMPHATAERELHYCEQLTSQFKQNAHTLIFSYAKKNESFVHQASPLIRDLPELDLFQLSLTDYQSCAEKIFAAKHIETIVDELAPALQPGEKIHGGVMVLKQQALCPFKAFAEWRLHAHELELPTAGLRAKDRGSILHKSLELVWNHLRSHDVLLSLSENDLDTAIQSGIDHALTTLQILPDTQTKYLHLEKTRLHRLLKDWLTLEKARSPFKVLNNECVAEINLNQLRLSVRIDRIDELDNGKKLIIDYKASRHYEISHWLSERPEEPQLPLYALLDPDKTIGVTFAQIVPGEHRFKGISQYQLDMKGIKALAETSDRAPNWQTQLSEWQRILTQLGTDFCLGHAEVNPKDPPHTCTWCALKPLCRIQETTSVFS